MYGTNTRTSTSHKNKRMTHKKIDGKEASKEVTTVTENLNKEIVATVLYMGGHPIQYLTPFKKEVHKEIIRFKAYDKGLIISQVERKLTSPLPAPTTNSIE
jgi:hypothetical protein